MHDATIGRFEIFPVAIGHYEADGLPDLDVEPQVGRLVELLAEFGAGQHRWPGPVERRDGDSVQRRMRAWADRDGVDSWLYWVGHGWSDGLDAALAHFASPAEVGTFGIRPEQLAEAVRRRLGSAGGWTVVVVDACQSARFVQLLNAELDRHPPGAYEEPGAVLLVGVAGRGATTLGRFTDALARSLHGTFRAVRTIALHDLATDLRHQLGGGTVRERDADGAALQRQALPAASLSGPLDTIRFLEDALDGLAPDERHHFLVKAQAAEQGEVSWFFEGRAGERRAVVRWLGTHDTGLLVVGGPAGAGKSALLGHLLVQTLPEVREALVRRGLIDPLPAGDRPPDEVFDATIHLARLIVAQVLDRVAQGAGLGAPPSAADRSHGLANDLDWLADRLARRDRPFTVLMDALDESGDPVGIAVTLVRRIASLPGVRVVLGSRVSTREAPDHPGHGDRDILDALGDADVVTVGREPDAVLRYVERRLREARDHPPRDFTELHRRRPGDDVIRQTAERVAGNDREFLFARLVVQELIQDPTLLTPGRARSLERLLAGTHRQLFDVTLARMGRTHDAFVPLIEALSLARGRGLPIADGIWGTIADGLSGGAGTSRADIQLLLDQTPAYVVIDVSHGQTVYRLAHRALVEHFAGDGQPDRIRRAGRVLLDLAGGHAPQDMPTYLRHHLPGHVAAAGQWADLADRPRILDGLSPDAVTAEAVTTLFGRGPLPVPVAGVVAARADLAGAAPADRAGRRQLAALLHSGVRALTEGPAPWGVRAATLPRSPLHLTMPGHRGFVTDICAFVLPDGRRLLASAGNDATIRLWNTATATPVGNPVTGHTGSIPCLAALPTRSGRVLLISAGQAGDLRVWDALSGLPATGMAPIEGDGPVAAVCGWEEADGAVRVAAAGIDGTLRIWDAETATMLAAPLAAHTGSAFALCAWTQDDGVRVATAGMDGLLRIWDPATGSAAGAPLSGHTGTVFGVCHWPGPQGRPMLASVGTDRTVRLWDATSGAAAGAPLEGHTRAILDICSWTGPGGGPRLATGGADGSIRIWDPLAGTAGPVLGGHFGQVSALTAWQGPHGTLLATAGSDGSVRMWDPAAPADAADDPTGNTPARACCTWTGPGGTLLAVAYDGQVRVWNPFAGTPCGPPLVGHAGAIWAVCAWAGRLVTTGHDGTVRIWDAETRSPLGAPLTGHAGPVFQVCVWSSDRLATVGEDGAVRLWDPAAGTEVAPPLTGHAGPVFGVCSWTGPGAAVRLATAGQDGTVRVWDPVAGRQVGEPMTGHEGPVGGVTVWRDRDGRPMLATNGLDGTVRVWDPAAGVQVGAALAGHSGVVRGVRHCTAGGAARLISHGDDMTVRVWDPLTATMLGHWAAGDRATISAMCVWDCAGEPVVTATNEDGTVRTWDLAGRPVGAALGDFPRSIEALAGAFTRTGDGRLRTGDPGRAVPVDAPVTTIAPAGPLLAIGRADGHLSTVDSAASAAVTVGTPVLSAPITASCPLPGLVAVGGSDGTVAIWDPRTGRTVTGPWKVCDAPVRALCALRTPDGDLLAVAGQDGLIRLWELARHRPWGAPLQGHRGWIWSLAQAGPRLVSAGADGTVRRWDPRTAAPIGGPLIGHEDQVRAALLLTTAGGGTLLASGGHDHRVRLWHADSGAPVPVTIDVGHPVHCLQQESDDTLSAGTSAGIVLLTLDRTLFT
ncbi:hypothetical protein OHA72_39080 [Dactylosporangium sp. NBC_01737]|uniref:hypothetical protein n=1 Tax=Dactylosporangium sp. NBC_01737 TaxID=2975959 RepID=UPI002E11E248|nr:hypothetical protein OHA72_39080 [Dactylosporangium sp. NBC_01737]